ncbi:5-formyltetrahydrofolate cyclo-ligase [Ruminococcus sp. HUN007]|nr:5-formyltetrahydrofolate cyclo-ligase [Ruminococcus sp. HUN007]
MKKDVTPAGICYSPLVFDEVPSEPHDVSVDYIITEKGIIDING